MVASAIEANGPECFRPCDAEARVSANEEGVRIDARRAEASGFCQRERCVRTVTESGASKRALVHLAGGSMSPAPFWEVADLKLT